MDAGAEGSRGAEWLHGHLRRYGDVYYTYMYVNQGEDWAARNARISFSTPFKSEQA